MFPQKLRLSIQINDLVFSLGLIIANNVWVCDTTKVILMQICYTMICVLKKIDDWCDLIVSA